MAQDTHQLLMDIEEKYVRDMHRWVMTPWYARPEFLMIASGVVAGVALGVSL